MKQNPEGTHIKLHKRPTHTTVMHHAIIIRTDYMYVHVSAYYLSH